MNCNLGDADFYMARMDRVTLNSCDATRASFSRAKLYRACLSNVNLQAASLDKAHCDRIVLDNVDFRKLDLSIVKFSGARVGRVVIARRQTQSFLRALGVQVIDGTG
jgi:uncharacterized protein YjbI with pentapeptide repeats